MRVDVAAEEAKRGVFGRLEVEVREPVARVLSSARGSSSSMSMGGSVVLLGVGFLGAVWVVDGVVVVVVVVVSASSVSRPSNMAESSASVGLVFLEAMIGGRRGCCIAFCAFD